MLFNSLSFLLFLPLVFALYWFAAGRRTRVQNVLLLAASYYFYACWDWRFLFLLIFSTGLDFYTALRMSQASAAPARKGWFWLSVIVNLAFLGLFKYFDFFAGSFAGLLSGFGFHVSAWTLGLVLPVGISFYTFHGLSYVIDVYKGRIEVERNAVDYALFVSFFPLLVAGPIERATHLLPQVKTARSFDYARAVDGLRQMLWGFFKKVVIADNCARFADLIFNDSAAYSGSTLLLGALFFTFQIYGDFSGYSDIALGTARLFGFELLRNFAFPYFSRDIAEFWRRWHISLSSWFRDYVYIPLGGSRGTLWSRIRNTVIIFALSGFWHGASWTFVMWGLLNALYFMPLLLSGGNRENLATVAQGRHLPSLRELWGMVLTFGLTVLAWVFFRSQNIGQAVDIVSGIFSASLFTVPVFPGMKDALVSLGLVGIFMLVEWLGREQQYAIEKLGWSWPRPLRYALYYILVIAVLWFGGRDQEFIYFQF